MARDPVPKSHAPDPLSLLLRAAAGRHWARYGPALVRAEVGSRVRWDWCAALIPLWGLYWNAWITLPYHVALAFIAGSIPQPLYHATGIELWTEQVFAAMCVVSALVKGRFGTTFLSWHVNRRVTRVVRRVGAAAAAEALAASAPNGWRAVRQAWLVLVFGYVGFALVDFGTEYIQYRRPRPVDANVAGSDAPAR